MDEGLPASDDTACVRRGNLCVCAVDSSRGRRHVALCDLYRGVMQAAGEEVTPPAELNDRDYWDALPWWWSARHANRGADDSLIPGPCDIILGLSVDDWVGSRVNDVRLCPTSSYSPSPPLYRFHLFPLVFLLPKYDSDARQYKKRGSD